MLRYLGYGPRQFGHSPMYVHRRANWEFFAVLQGRCGPLLPTAEPPRLHARHLWVFPPDVPHGWGGEVAQPCHVAIFHFGTVPALLEKATRRAGHLGVSLSAAQARSLARLARELQPHFQHATEKSLLVFERALLDLSLLALESVPADRTEADSDFALRKIEAAIAWYAEHMEEQPKLDRVAAAIGVSGRHLRRLFHDARQESPQAAFTRLRLHRAMEMLSRSRAKLDAIARACGFSSSSDFCRVFNAHQMISPDAWRRTHLRDDKESGSPAASPP